MKFYLENLSDVFNAIGSTPKGLSSDEAKKRLEKYGHNKLKEGKKTPLIVRFFQQMLDPMILILLAAAVVSAITAYVQHEGSGFADVFIILFVVIVNAVLGVYQENKAEKAIEALQQMTAATSKVLRDGEICHVKSDEIVPGDVVILEAGDAVPADCRIFECASMKIEEAALTGESVPVTKMMEKLVPGTGNDVALGDRKNMVYMGSSVAYGRGKAVVTGTGMETEMGKIANALAQAEDGLTPLQKKLAQLSKILTFVVLGICVFIFGLNLFEAKSFNLDVILNSFMIAVSLAVAAIPEGLAAVVTVVLSIGVTNMSKRNAVIRKLTAVETLGCAQIICSDKTGTLTQNKMTVVDRYGENEELLGRAMALCSDAEIQDGAATGEPTECALVEYALKLGMDKNNLKNAFPRVGEAPFDSMRKMMSTVHRQQDGTVIQYTKGAPDVVLNRCTSILKDGKVVPMTDDDRAEIVKANKAMADKALRVLCAAEKQHSAVPEDCSPEKIEEDLTFIGLTGMIDPVRPEVKDAIVECREAGIRPIMITGDHRDTAVAIAKELGIITDESEAITGADLNEMSDEEFEKNVVKYSVYARVQPEHKVRIVNAWRKLGMVTAMTGDGVNDAPSIKSADIGVGMGITGTDVTKNVADMVLADDNFATIVSAVEEGRRIYDNIRKTIQFLLASNLSEVLCILVATIGLGALTGGPFTILLPVHLLWINLVTDCFPAIGLGMEKAERNIMKRKPRSADDGIFAGGLGIDLLYQGILITFLTVTAYVLGFNAEVDASGLHNHAITMAFMTMSMCEIFHSFNMRSQRGSVLGMSVRGSHNMFLYGSMIASLVLTSAVIYIPFLANAFQLVPLSFAEYAEALLLAFAVIPIVEIVKIFQRANRKRKAK